MKPLVRALEIATLVACAVFVVALFVNQPDDAPVAAVPSNDTSSPEPTGADDPGDPGDETPPGTPGIDLALGEDLYGRCAGCHGRDGGGGFGPPLGPAVVAAYPDPADQAAFILAGRGSMPSYEGDFSDDELASLVEYTRQLPG